VAACWFNYLLYFLNKVVVTEAAPAALLSGQICDGLATPVVGMLSDKFNTRIGQRKPWYIAGLVLVVMCYIPLWSGFSTENVAGMYAFYTIFAGVFNFGWASLQISHMSLVPSLTCSRKRRVTHPLFRTSSTI
jgi:Na+/melibiose symporter-like transporter